MPIRNSLCQPGKRVRITQQLPMREEAWTAPLEGVIMRCQQSMTGSWFAHAKDDRLWLDRMELRLDDGELVTLILDQYTVIEELGDEQRRSENGGRPPRS